MNNSNNTNTNTNNEVKKNAASSYPKTEKSQKKLVKINEPRKSVYEPPIYHITSSNENDMAKVLSRKMVMKKKKNKTNNKYDFLIYIITIMINNTIEYYKFIIFIKI